MNTDEFWNLIDSVQRESGGLMERKCDLLNDRLVAAGETELRDFLRHFDTMDAAAYTWPLWGAAYVMNGGCSDDSFSDFRATLISQGRATFEKALADPDSLADLRLPDGEDICHEGFQYVGQTVASEELGITPEQDVSFPANPTGSEWEEEELATLFPRLWAKYGSGGGEDGGSSRAAKPWWKVW